MVCVFQFGRVFFTGRGRGGLSGRRGVLGSRGSGLCVGFCSGRGLSFCEGVDFPVDLINLQFEGGLGAGWHGRATS